MKDLLNKKFGRLTVIEKTDIKKDRNFCWLCQCDCGNIKLVQGSRLISGRVQSCGCLREEYNSRLESGESAFNVLYARYKINAKIRNFSFVITKNEFKLLTSGDCYYCGIKPHKKVTEGHKYNNGNYIYNGLDRLNNFEGYTVENCVTCCETCNRAKLQMSVEEFYNWIDRVYKYKSKVSL